MTGPELKRLRERAGLTQRALADLAWVSERTVIRWEVGDVEIPTKKAERLLPILREAAKQKGRPA
jgi:DNA-binding transcriptional regulator YiaG